jgi:anti-anti-sigma factor
MSLEAVTPICPSKYRLVVAIRGVPLVRVVEVVGEVDLLTAPVLADCLGACLSDATPLTVVVDLRQVSFLAVAGLSVLVAADQYATVRHSSLRLVVTTLAVHRVLSVTGLDHTLMIYPALETALAS